MKKLLSVLLMVVMLASLSAAAFAADSPSRDTGGGGGWDGGPVTKEPAIEKVEIVAEDDIVFDKDCDGAVTNELGDTDAAAQKDAKNALTPTNLTKALAGDQKTLQKGNGKTAVCTNPQLISSATGEYPCFIKYTVDHHIDTVMLFIDGAWKVPADLQIVDNADGSCTVSFTLEGPAFYSNIAFR